MKILHVAEHFAPMGGIETYILALIPLLEERGHENHVIYRRYDNSTLSILNVRQKYIPITDNPAFDQDQINNFVANSGADIIYLHDVYDPELIALLSQLVPAIGYIHIFYPVCPGLGKLFRRNDTICDQPYGMGCIPNIYVNKCASAKNPVSVYKIMRNTNKFLRAYRNLPKVLVASEYMSQLLIQNGIDRERLQILPYFVPMPEESADIGRTFDDFEILFAGRLEYEKGLPYLLEALDLIPPHFKLLVVGDGSLKSTYIKSTEKLGLSDRVTFTGWLSSDELEAAYRHCKVAVMPSLMPEPYGKVGIEAMVNRRPVVAFEVGGIPDWLKDGINGFLVEPRNTKQLAEKINTLLDSSERAIEMGINGRRFVEENLNQTQHINELIRIFERHIVPQY